MKRWLALRRWRLLVLTAVAVALRIILAVVFHFVDSERPTALAAQLAMLTACDVAMCALAIAAIVAFVQYGRLYNARVPTE